MFRKWFKRDRHRETASKSKSKQATDKQGGDNTSSYDKTTLTKKDEEKDKENSATRKAGNEDSISPFKATDSEKNKKRLPRNNCHPCSERGHNYSADMWCTVCYQLLCASCYSHHEVFQATRNHKVISIVEYSELMSTLKNISIVCESHPEKTTEYFCIAHQKICCIVCKNELHYKCLTKSINEVSGTEKYHAEFEKSFDIMKVCIDYLDRMYKNRESAASNLEKYREDLLRNWKISRSSINEWLDKIEKQSLTKFESMYLQEMEAITKQCKECEDKKICIEKRLQIASQIRPFKTSHTAEVFLAMLKICNDTAMDQKYLENQQNNVYDISFCCKTSSKPLQNIKELQLIDDASIEHVRCDIKMISGEQLQHDVDSDLLTSSSVVEEEIQVDITSKTSTSHENRQIKTDEKRMPQNLLKHKLSDHVKSNPNLHEQNSLSAYQGYIGSQFRSYSNLASLQISMKQKHVFYVQRYESCIHLVDIMALSEGEVAILETSTPRLLIYKRNGKSKRGQVLFPDPPNCLTLFEDTQIAITLPYSRRIAIVDKNSLTIKRFINVSDVCRGICVSNNHLIVNCVNRGLLAIDINGIVIRVIANVKEELYLCSAGNGNVFSMKCDSRLILRYNIERGGFSKFFVKGLEDPRGITIDSENNLYVSGWVTDTIYRKADRFLSAEVFIDDGLNGANQISYDKATHEIVAINDDKKSVVTFGY